jgi:hypothetical protein
MAVFALQSTYPLFEFAWRRPSPYHRIDLKCEVPVLLHGLKMHRRQ